jgi:hypothetical protein
MPCSQNGERQRLTSITLQALTSDIAAHLGNSMEENTNLWQLDFVGIQEADEVDVAAFARAINRLNLLKLSSSPSPSQTGFSGASGLPQPLLKLN